MEWLGLILLYIISGYMKKRQQVNQRKKIEKDPKNPKFLQTIRGAGYVLWIE